MQLLQQDPKKRLDSLEGLKQESLMADVDWESVEAVNVQPGFVPPVSYSSSNSAASMGWDIIVPTLYIQTSIYYYVFYCRQLIMLHLLSAFFVSSFNNNTK